MRRSCLAVVIALGVPAAALGGSFEKALMKLSPEERAHQACAKKGLETIRRDNRLPGVDRIQPDTFKRARLEGSVVMAKGAAVRAKSHWYALAFECTVSDDQLKAMAFTYQLGAEIPPDRWEEAGLWR